MDNQTKSPRMLIICYSLEGSTLRVANTLASITKADVKQVKPVRQIPSHGFGKYFLGGMQAIFKVTPALQPIEVNPAAYDLLVIGAPTWGGHLASPMRSWLKRANLSGKRVAIFATCQGSAGNTLQDMRQLLPACEVVGEHSFVIKPGHETSTSDEAKQWQNQLLK